MGSRVYFGRLPRDCRERDIEKLLKGFGDIREIHLRNGYGFVEFRDSRDADDAVYDLHGRDFMGDRLIVEHARSSGRGVRPPPPIHTSHRVIVENVSSSASWQDLKDFMKKAGEVAFADCHKEREGEGVVEYHSYDDVKYALERLDGADFRGHKIRIIDTSDSHSKSRRRSRSRSRSRSPSRSRSGRRSSRRSPSPRRRRRSPSPRRSRSPRRSVSLTRSSRRDRSSRRSLTPVSRHEGSVSPRFEKEEEPYHSEAELSPTSDMD